MVKKDLVVAETGEVRDSTSLKIHLDSGEQKNFQWGKLDGERGVSYLTEVYIVSQISDT
jgi:hypothetical protein